MAAESENSRKVQDNNPDRFERAARDESGQQESTMPDSSSAEGSSTLRLSGMFQDWFLDYASYVIMERAVPEVRDGLKPVQRRILHAMKDLDDGRYNKVANIIGHTMKYHPHGDASIGDALVQLGQKELLIDTQGNWGNILTGDSAAAPRYIEARPSKFALEVLYNPRTTTWKASYDGRNKEPVSLPVKFPLLLAQGVEGIAVGLASKILPHNFIELIDASIAHLKGEKFQLLPDFATGGLADVSKYADGLRGGKLRVRARINVLDKKTLVITEIPFGTTTSSLMDSIVAANDRGKIKIRKIEDNTSGKVEILVHLAPGISPDQAIDALYLFSDCEVSISPNTCVIDGDKPRFLGVSEILRISTDNTLALLRSELEIERHDLLEQMLYASLEKIFIEHKIYQRIEECETWESVIETIDEGISPFKPEFYREITRDDIIRLTEIKIKRISRYDAFKADELVRRLQEKLSVVKTHLENLVAYAIAWFEGLREKYGKGRERRTEIRLFDTIEAARVAVANEKLYVNRAEGFAGYGIKKDEYVCDCSDLDEIIVFREDGSFMVSKVAEKSFVGKGIIHIGVFDRNDERTIYNMIYQDGPRGAVYMKRFAVKGVTRDKEYSLTRGTKGSKVLYFTANPNGEAEVLTIYLRHKPKLKKPVFDLDLSQLAIKGRSATGNLVTRHAVRRIVLKDQGVSTLGALDVWFDDAVLRLNSEKRGQYLGAFRADDRILAVYESGQYRVMGYDLSSHFDEKPLLLQKYDDEKVLTVVYHDGETGLPYIKRFIPENNGRINDFLNEHKESRLLMISVDASPRLLLQLPAGPRKPASEELIEAESFIGVKSYKARGKRVSTLVPDSMQWENADSSELIPDGPDETDASEPPQLSAENKSESQYSQESKADVTDISVPSEDDKAGVLDKLLDEVPPSPATATDAGGKAASRSHAHPSDADKQKQIRLDLDI